jgi:hypothetical protein
MYLVTTNLCPSAPVARVGGTPLLHTDLISQAGEMVSGFILFHPFRLRRAPAGPNARRSDAVALALAHARVRRELAAAVRAFL